MKNAVLLLVMALSHATAQQRPVPETEFRLTVRCRWVKPRSRQCGQRTHARAGQEGSVVLNGPMYRVAVTGAFVILPSSNCPQASIISRRLLLISQGCGPVSTASPFDHGFGGRPQNRCRAFSGFPPQRLASCSRRGRDAHGQLQRQHDAVGLRQGRNAPLRHWRSSNDSGEYG